MTTLECKFIPGKLYKSRDGSKTAVFVGVNPLLKHGWKAVFGYEYGLQVRGLNGQIYVDAPHNDDFLLEEDTEE